MTYLFPADIEGYSSPDMCQELYRLACEVPPGGTIVELGTYKGRTAVAMAMSGRNVWAIDRFKSESEEFNPYPDHRDGNFSAELVRANAEKYHVRVRVLDATTEEAWRFWVWTNKPAIDLLFIDADHSYEAVKADFQDWSQLVTENGVIVFDDVLWDGPMRLLQEIDDWAPIPGPQFGGMTAMRRIKEMADARRIS